MVRAVTVQVVYPSSVNTSQSLLIFPIMLGILKNNAKLVEGDDIHYQRIYLAI